MYKLLSQSIDRYYHALSKTGYRSQEVVDALLMLCAMTELTSTYLRSFISDCDKRRLDSAAHKLLDKCIIREPKLTSIKPNQLGLMEKSESIMDHVLIRDNKLNKLEDGETLPCKEQSDCGCNEIRP